jgi:hypothetical protein
MTKPERSATTRALHELLEQLLLRKRLEVTDALRELNTLIQQRRMPSAEDILEVLSEFSVSHTVKGSLKPK